MIHVLASIHVKAGKEAEFLMRFKANVPNVLGEKGCIAYTPTLDVPTGLPVQQLNASVITLIEQWRNLEDLRAHLSAPHMLAYREQVNDLVDHVSLKVLTEA